MVRGVGLPDAARPAFAVIVDIPKNDGLDNHLRDETSVKLGAVSIVLTDGLRARLLRPKRAVEGLLNRDAARRRAKRRHQVGGVPPGHRVGDRAGGPDARRGIEVNIAEIYDRLSSVPVGSYNLGAIVLAIMVLVAVLFLADRGGRAGDGAGAGAFDHRVGARAVRGDRARPGRRLQPPHRGRSTRDQLGDLAESFNQMTGSIEDLLRQAEEKKRLEEELRIARAIQMSLLPRGQLAMPGAVRQRALRAGTRGGRGLLRLLPARATTASAC